MRLRFGVLTAKTWRRTFGRRRCAEKRLLTAERTSVCRTRSRTKLTCWTLESVAGCRRRRVTESERIDFDGGKTQRTADVIDAGLWQLLINFTVVSGYRPTWCIIIIIIFIHCDLYNNNIVVDTTSCRLIRVRRLMFSRSSDTPRKPREIICQFRLDDRGREGALYFSC